MFLILNNGIAFNKQIMSICPPPYPEKTQQLNDINISGYTTGQICRSKDITLVLNGCIKNLNKIAQKMGYNETTLDVLIEIYTSYGFEYMIQLLEGEFSIILLDHDLNKTDLQLFIAQDRLGQCPLYVFTEDTTSDRKILAFSNTAKQLHMDSILYEIKYSITPFLPGTYTKYEYPFKVLSYWKPVLQNIRYVVSYPKKLVTLESKTMCREEFLKSIEIVKDALCESIGIDIDVCRGETIAVPPNKNRQLPTLDPPSQPLPVSRYRSTSKPIGLPNSLKSPPVACLLSGGIDSSIMTALIKDHYGRNDYDSGKIYTFTMGFQGSNDFKYAKEVVDYLGILDRHNEFVLEEENYMAVIPKVIEILETTDIATIRYGAALYILLKHIRDTTEIRDIFTGDGADEIMGGYLNFSYMNNLIERDHECHRLLEKYNKRGALYRKLFDYFDMRWYKPFLNDCFLTKYMSIPMDIRYIGDFDKNLLVTSFSVEHFMSSRYMELLPKRILCRAAEPGYDSISSYYRPLLCIIGERIDGDKEAIKEMEYYKDIFKKNLPHMSMENNESPPFKYATCLYEPTMRNLDLYLEYHMEYQDRSL